MTLIPIAAFLAGSLLTLLIPALLLISLVVWYIKFASHLPASEAPSVADVPAPPDSEGDKPHDA